MFSTNNLQKIASSFTSLDAISKKEIEHAHSRFEKLRARRGVIPLFYGIKPSLQETELEKDKAELAKTTAAINAISVTPIQPIESDSDLKIDESQIPNLIITLL